MFNNASGTVVERKSEVRQETCMADVSSLRAARERRTSTAEVWSPPRLTLLSTYFTARRSRMQY